MEEYPFSVTSTPQGPLQRFGAGSNSTSVFASPSIREHKSIGVPVHALLDALATTGETITVRAPDLTHTGRVKLASDLVERTVKPEWRRVRDAVAPADADLAARANAVRLGEPLPAAQGAELRGAARSMKLPDLIAVTAADRTMRRAVVEASPLLSGVPADIHSRLAADERLAVLADRFASQSITRTAPTADDPIGGKPDMPAARALAEATLAAWDGERETIDAVGPFLSSVVGAVAFMTDTPREDALKALLR